MRLMAVRHQKTVAPEGFCYGRTDLAVAEGQEADLAALMARLDAPSAVVSSPLRRCRSMAEAIGRQFGLEPRVDARLAEMDFGRWEMQPWSQIPRDEIDAWAADFMHARPHGGESVAMLRERARRAVFDARNTRADTVLVTHAGVIRALLAKGETAQDWRFDVPFGACIEIGGAVGEP